MSDTPRSKSLLADSSLILVAIIWGSGFIASQYAIDSGMSTSLIMAMRFTIATVTLLAVFYKKIREIQSSDLKKGVIAGILLFLAFYSQTLGLVFTTPSNNAFITATNVVMVPFISWMIFKKRPLLKSFLTAFSCLAGIGVLTYSHGSGFIFSIGDLFTLICAFFFAAHISYLDIVAKSMDVKILTLVQMATAAILSLLVLFLFDFSSVRSADFSTGLLPVIYLGLFSTCICFLVQTSAQKFTSSTKAAILLSTEGFFGSLFSVLLRMETLTVNLLIGGVIIIGSVILSEANFNMKKRKKIGVASD